MLVYRHFRFHHIYKCKSTSLHQNKNSFERSIQNNFTLLRQQEWREWAAGGTFKTRVRKRQRKRMHTNHQKWNKKQDPKDHKESQSLFLYTSPTVHSLPLQLMLFIVHKTIIIKYESSTPLNIAHGVKLLIYVSYFRLSFTSGSSPQVLEIERQKEWRFLQFFVG